MSYGVLSACTMYLLSSPSQLGGHLSDGLLHF